jgi:hypothetical protein
LSVKQEVGSGVVAEPGQYEVWSVIQYNPPLNKEGFLVWGIMFDLLSLIVFLIFLIFSTIKYFNSRNFKKSWIAVALFHASLFGFILSFLIFLFQQF